MAPKVKPMGKEKIKQRQTKKQRKSDSSSESSLSSSSAESQSQSDESREEIMDVVSRTHPPSSCSRPAKKQKTTTSSQLVVSKPKPGKLTKSTKEPPISKSARSHPNPENIDIGSLHPWLNSLSGEERDRMLYYNSLQHEGERTLDFEDLKTVDGAFNRVRAFLDEGWINLFEIHDDSFQELTVEFISTFSFEEEIITFQLGGERRTLTMQDWAIALGIYSKRDVKSSTWIDSIKDWPNEMKRAHKNSFLKEIAVIDKRVPDSISRPNARQIKDPALRIIHRVIANTIHHRHESQGHVSDADLFLLYALKNGLKVNLAYVLARYFKKFSKKVKPSKVTGGSYVTRLVRHFGFLTKKDRATLTQGPVVGSLNVKILEKMHLVKFDPEKKKYVLDCDGGRLSTMVPKETTKCPPREPVLTQNVIAGTSSSHPDVLTPSLGEVMAKLNEILKNQKEILAFVRGSRGDGSGPSSSSPRIDPLATSLPHTLALSTPLVTQPPPEHEPSDDGTDDGSSESSETSNEESRSAENGSNQGDNDDASAHEIAPPPDSVVSMEQKGARDTAGHTDMSAGTDVASKDVNVGSDSHAQQ